MSRMRTPARTAVPDNEFADALGLTPDEVSERTGIVVEELAKIIEEIATEMNIPPLVLLNLVRSFGMSEGFLLNLAVRHDRPALPRKGQPMRPRSFQLEATFSTASLEGGGGLENPWQIQIELHGQPRPLPGAKALPGRSRKV